MSADVSSIAEGLRTLGLSAGDDVVVHSSLRALGNVEGGAPAVVDALRAVLGVTGTLVVPAFTYGIGLTDLVDQRTTPGRTGAIAEAARAQPEARRSDHPTHSVVALGQRAQELTASHLSVRAFGVGSPLDRLAANGGKVLLLGVGHTSNSTIHVAEERALLPKPNPTEGLRQVTVRCLDGHLAACTLDSSPSCSAAFGTLEAHLRSRDAVADGTVAGALSQLMHGRAVIEAVGALLGEQPDAMLCRRPACAPCARTRTALTEQETAC